MNKEDLRQIAEAMDNRELRLREEIKKLERQVDAVSAALAEERSRVDALQGRLFAVEEILVRRGLARS